MLLDFQIHFFATRTSIHLVRTISLLIRKNKTIHRTTFVLALNNAENIHPSENIVIACVSFTSVPPPPSKDNSWLTGVSHQTLTIRAISCTLFYVESLSCTLSTCFELLYMNMYHIGLSDGTVSHYMLRLKIYWAPLYLREKFKIFLKAKILSKF